MPSSRTPDGTPNQCAICGSAIVIAPSTFPTSDAPCPVCGSLLWFAAPAESPTQTKPRFRLPAESASSLAQSLRHEAARARQRPASLWTRFAAIQFDIKAPRPLGQFGCGLLLMSFIEVLLWLTSGDVPSVDRGTPVMHLTMALLFCGCAEFFRTDGRNSRWQVLECKIGLMCACLAIPVCARFALEVNEWSLNIAVFVVFVSLVAAMMALFLTIGILAMAGDAFQLLHQWRRGSRALS